MKSFSSIIQRTILNDFLVFLEFHQKDNTFYRNLRYYHHLNESRLRDNKVENPYRIYETRFRYIDDCDERPYFVLNDTMVTFEREFYTSKYGGMVFEQLMSFKKGEEVKVLTFIPPHIPTWERGTIEKINPDSYEVLINNKWIYCGRLFKLDERLKWKVKYRSQEERISDIVIEADQASQVEALAKQLIPNVDFILDYEPISP